jgi:hypothetical protein
MTHGKTLGLFTLSLLAGALLAAAPAFAAGGDIPAAAAQPQATTAQPAEATPAALAPATAAVALATAGCGEAQATDLFPALAQAGGPAPAASLAGPACTLARESGIPSKLGGRPFHGFCACSCTHIPNCNTSADCGGGACLPGITCC